MKLLYSQAGDPRSRDLRPTLPETKPGPGTHYQVSQKEGGWHLYRVRIDVDELGFEHRTERLLAAYRSEQEAELAALALLGLDVGEEARYVRGTHGKGKMMRFPKEGKWTA